MLEKLEKANVFNAISEGRVVRLQSVNGFGSRTRPMFKCAVKDGRSGKILTGAEILDENEFEKHPIQKRATSIKAAAAELLILDKEGTEANDGDNTPAVAIEHNMTLDLSNDRDAALLLFVFLDGSVASTKSKVNKIQHIFYVEDKKAEAGIKLTALTNKAKALEYIKSIEPYLLDAYVALLNLYLRPETISASEKDLALYEMADTKPADVIRLFEDKTLEWKLILQSFINKKIIRVDNNRKEYMANDTLIGTTFSEALTYIMDDKNQAVVNNWRQSVTGNKVSA